MEKPADARRHLRLCSAMVGAATLLLLSPSLRADQPAGKSLRATWVRRSTAPDTQPKTTQHQLSLAKRSSTAVAVDTPTRLEPATVLRWRTPGISQTPTHSAGGREPTAVLTVSRSYNNGLSIQPASLDAPVTSSATSSNTRPDAFSDPFGDRQLAPAPPEQLPVAIDSQSQLTPIDESSATLTQLPPNEPVQPLPIPKTDQQKTTGSCRRTYNERDCCKAEDRCLTAVDKWQSSAISKISLDIAPAFRPDEDDSYKEETARERELSKSPVRTWRDRNGNELGTGRLANIKRGRVLIIDGSGKIAYIRFVDICDDDLCFLASWWGVPNECTLGDQAFAGRSWQPTTLTWKATAACHKPLYFEEVGLERYGHTAGPIRQPLLSGAHFFASLVTLPYQAGIHPPWECRYALGYYRPGSCAPYLVPPIPLSLRGALWEAGFWVGGVALIP